MESFFTGETDLWTMTTIACLAVVTVVFLQAILFERMRLGDMFVVFDPCLGLGFGGKSQ